MTPERLAEIGKHILHGGNLSSRGAAELFEYATGHDISSPSRCRACNGTAIVVRIVKPLGDHDPLAYERNEPCVSCGGTGYFGGFTWGKAEADLMEVIRGRFA